MKKEEMNIDPRCLAMIRDLSNAPSPSGFEDETLAVVRQYAEGLGEIKEDRLRNLYIRPAGENRTSGKPLLMLDAHGDEVGFMVHSVKDNGTIRFVTLGGWDPGTLPGSKVLVRNAEGAFIPGLIAAKPPHFMKAAESGARTEIRDLVIDVGARSKEEAIRDFGIRVGEPIVPDVSFQYDEKHDIMTGKAFDCRIGVAALIETMKRLAAEDLQVDLAGVVSAQEEVGDRGIKVAVNQVRPDIAICFEGCPADDTFTEPYAIQTALKKGPMLRFMDVSVICSPRYMRYTLDLAERLGLAVQASVREGGGNNGAVITTALDGVPVIVIGIPVRYIHSHYGITSYYDFEAAVRLATELIRSLDADIIQSF